MLRTSGGNDDLKAALLGTAATLAGLLAASVVAIAECMAML